MRRPLTLGDLWRMRLPFDTAIVLRVNHGPIGERFARDVTVAKGLEVETEEGPKAVDGDALVLSW